jgi:hypothetical protein
MKRKIQEKIERRSRKKSSSVRGDRMETDRKKWKDKVQQTKAHCGL